MSEQRKWADLTSAQIIQALSDEGIPLAGSQGTKAKLVGFAESMLGSDPDHPQERWTAMRERTAAGTTAIEDAHALIAEPGERSVVQRMLDVLADLPAIGKDERAPGNMGGYAFRGIEQITAAIKPLLARHGVLMVPRVIAREEGSRPVGNAKTMFVIDQHIEFTFYGPAGDSVVASMWGEGTDMGDKATQKAATSAFKSMLSITFCISDAATDSERHDVPETDAGPVLAPVADLKTIGEWIAAAGEHGPVIKAEVADKFGPSRDLAADQVDAVIDYIEARTALLRAEKAPDAPIVVPDDTVECGKCSGTGLVLEGDAEIVCGTCSGAKVVCVECLLPVDAHDDDCSRKPF